MGRHVLCLSVVLVCAIGLLAGCGGGGSDSVGSLQGLPPAGGGSTTAARARADAEDRRSGPATGRFSVPWLWSVVSPGDVLVADAGSSRVVGVNPTTGEQRVVTEDLEQPQGVVYGPDGSLYTTLLHPAKLVRVSAESGAVTVVSEDNLFQFVTDVALEASGQLVVSSDSLGPNSGVIRVNPFNGTQTWVTPQGAIAPTAIAAWQAGGALYVVDANRRQVAEVSTATGSITPVSIAGLGAPVDVDVSAQGDLLVADQENGYVLSMPRGGGSPTVLNPDHRIYLAGVAAGSQASIFANDAETLYRIADGRTTLVSTGGLLSGARHISVAPSMFLAIQDLAIDTASGSFRLVGTFATESAMDPRVVDLVLRFPPLTSWVIPAGSLAGAGNGRYRFNGVIAANVRVNAEILALDANRYGLQVHVQGTDLPGLSNPVTVQLGTAPLSSTMVQARFVGR